MRPRRGVTQSVSDEPPSTPKSSSSPSPKPTASSSSSALQRSPALSPLKETYDRVADSMRRPQVASPFRFVCAVILSFALSSLLFSITAEFTAGDLAAISKHTESWAEITGLLSWKVLQLAIFWFGDLDATETLALTFVTCTPTNLLLLQYYSIRPTTVLFTLSANLLSITTPIKLLRPNPSSGGRSSTLAPKGPAGNGSPFTDIGTLFATSGLAAAILAVLLELSFATFLPVHLVTHFAGIRNLSVSHLGAAGLLPLLAGLWPVGAAIYQFLFLPTTKTSTSADSSSSSSSTSSSKSSPKKYTFDPATASFSQHLYHNAWGWYSPRQKSLIRRTVLLADMLMAETVIQVWGTIKGVELWGATCYAAIWAVGILVTGLAFNWVGQPIEEEK